MNTASRLRLLVLLLRLAGGVTTSAFLAMFLPGDWMAAAHRWLGLGEFPRTAIVDYLVRSVAALYGFHGVLLLLVSRDPLRHRTIVSFLAFMNIGLGVMLTAIDLRAGLPWWWVLGEGPPIVMFGAIVGLLNRSLPAGPARVA
jgi:hypothetical protein